ncbi:MAG: histidine kinase, partial [Bacteroidetes bacterium]|nr:histidine kinase [Bacteroidota bacterium]
FTNEKGTRLCKVIIHPGRLFQALLTKNKVLLLGCFNGLWKFKNGKHTLFKSEPELQGRINDIVEQENGDIWVATDKYGVICIKHLSGKLEHYTLKDGLPANKINILSIDRDGNVWAATNNGVAVIDFKNKLIEKYSTANGLLNDQVKNLACYNNELWMGTDAGICICDIKKLRIRTIPANIVISNVLVNNKPLKVVNNHFSFSYNQNNLSFLFDGLSFKTAAGCDFLYLLSGYEKNWHNSNEAKVSYMNLLPGNYEFIVYAINNEGIHSKLPAKFKFKINPPFWKTWWFITLLIVVWIALTYQLIKWRIKIFKRKTEEKNKIIKQLTEYQLTAIQAQMNPHFIFNVISSIQNFILDKDTDEAYDYLAQFARLIRLILQHSKENYISIEKELEMLKIYISLEQLRLNKKFDFVVKISPEIDTFSELLPVMLLQPYLENSIWHGIMPMDKSKSGVITLSIAKRNQKQLEITIEDNGVGRSKASELRKKTEHTSMAMTLNQKRLDLFNAELNVIDKYDENNIATGTMIELVI